MTIFPLQPADILLLFDTETSGLPLFGQPSDDPRQPKILQLAALLCDFKGNKLSSMDALLCWPGIEIDHEALKVHGITREKSETFGIDPGEALRLFMAMWRRCTCRVAHNQSFDARIIRIGLKQAWYKRAPDHAEEWRAGKSYCTMQATRPIMRLPPTEKMKATARYREAYKSPSLKEAFRWATGEEMKGAHNAMYDVMAMKRVLFSLADFRKDMMSVAPPVSSEDSTPPTNTTTSGSEW